MANALSANYLILFMHYNNKYNKSLFKLAEGTSSYKNRSTLINTVDTFVIFNYFKSRNSLTNNTVTFTYSHLE